MANWANCCLLLLPCRITRMRRATYPNPKFAKHPHVPLTHLGGTSRCFASPNCRAEHVNVPPGPLQQGWRCFAIFGLGTGISPISRTGKAILSRMQRAAVRHLPISAPGAQEEPIWWFLVGAHVRLFGRVAPRGEEIAGQARDEEVWDGGCPLGGRGPRVRDGLGAKRRRGSGCRSIETAAKQETESRSKDLNSVSAVRTRLELATPGVTGRYSKPTELPHQLSVNFPFGIAKVQLKFDSANILKDFNEKNVRPRWAEHFQRVCGRGRSLEREGCFTTKGKVAGPRREGHRTL